MIKELDTHIRTRFQFLQDLGYALTSYDYPSINESVGFSPFQVYSYRNKDIKRVFEIRYQLNQHDKPMIFDVVKRLTNWYDKFEPSFKDKYNYISIRQLDNYLSKSEDNRILKEYKKLSPFEYIDKSANFIENLDLIRNSKTWINKPLIDNCKNMTSYFEGWKQAEWIEITKEIFLEFLIRGILFIEKNSNDLPEYDSIGNCISFIGIKNDIKVDISSGYRSREPEFLFQLWMNGKEIIKDYSDTRIDDIIDFYNKVRLELTNANNVYK
jgi:hypothetical protein